MYKIIITVILTSAFFILFFRTETKNKKKESRKAKKRVVEKVSTTKGFIEDTYRGPVTDRFIPPKYGDIGTFVGNTSLPNFGFPYERLSEEELKKKPTKKNRKSADQRVSGVFVSKSG